MLRGINAALAPCPTAEDSQDICSSNLDSLSLIGHIAASTAAKRVLADETLPRHNSTKSTHRLQLILRLVLSNSQSSDREIKIPLAELLAPALTGN